MEYDKLQYNPFQDWKANQGNVKAQLVLFLFMLATLVRSNRILIILFFWYLIFYRFTVEWVLGIELPWSLRAGSGLKIQLGQALVVNGGAILGRNVALKQCTTIGNRQNPTGTGVGPSSRIGNNVDIGSNVCILGDIEIGDNCIMGAGSVVVKSVLPNSVVVGNPGRVIRQL